MTRNRIISVVLLLALGGWLFITVIGPKRSAKKSTSNRPATGNHQPIEPQFNHEGNLWILDSASTDTVETLAVEFAQSAEEIQYGMMYRKHMEDNTGMLFFMPDERPQSFWMKNTYVSLDLIYINRDMEIVSMQENAEPLNERSLPSTYPALYVLEVKGGHAANHGIRPGMKVKFEPLSK